MSSLNVTHLRALARPVGLAVAIGIGASLVASPAVASADETQPQRPSASASSRSDEAPPPRSGLRARPDTPTNRYSDRPRAISQVSDDQFTRKRAADDDSDVWRHVSDDELFLKVKYFGK